MAGIGPWRTCATCSHRAIYTPSRRSPNHLADAITASRNNSHGIELLVIDNDYYKTCVVDYHGGDRFPHLVRDETKPDYLGQILQPAARRE